jgi:hypothetical protein
MPLDYWDVFFPWSKVVGLWKFNNATPIGTLIKMIEANVDISLWQTLAIKRPIEEADKAVTL